jgi:hypothetical protein
MVKAIASMLIGLALIGSATTAVAGGHKTDVWHCGCVAYAPGAVAPWGTAFLEWSLLNVSQKSNGHQQHNQYDPETCSYTLDESGVLGSADYYRVADDCQEVGAVALEGVAVCSATPEFDGALCDGPPPPS